jgi:hypothetical protein
LDRRWGDRGAEAPIKLSITSIGREAERFGSTVFYVARPPSLATGKSLLNLRDLPPRKFFVRHLPARKNYGRPEGKFQRPDRAAGRAEAFPAVPPDPCR